MKTLSIELQQHLEQPVTTLTDCLKLTRRDGMVMGFTSLDEPLLFDGVNYVAQSGFQTNDMRDQSNIGSTDSQILALLNDDSVTEADVLAGRYDHAEIEVFTVNYTDLTQGKLTMRTGWLGEVETHNNQLSAEVKGLSHRLGNTIGELYSPLCRATLGDARCGVDLTSLTVSGTITEVTDLRIMRDEALTQESGYFAHGLMTFTSGANAGISMEVKEFSQGGHIITVLPMPWLVAVGDSYSLQAGCDKTFSTCKDRFDNVVSFRGEPHMPGLDSLLETPATSR